ncbi:valine--tRNA ligase [Methylovirgula sp. HY1]|uniref:valine--tRNA ligase n=1 Tax=Methylovirgula sp. HY1 TaxID=2822761 RepID=UPI001C5B51D7|nr:valine--tRNA ligase [Methylovirgula sp. HY1]
MDKTFDPAKVEGRISSLWEAAGAFRAGRPERAGAEAFTVVIPPPNVTGSLHMGHALNNTLQDILCRFERMCGKDVLWQPGTDHAGIATQMVVERQLAAKNQDRRGLGREKFLEEVWRWKEESGGAIVNQLKRLGASCDWERERFTMDEGLSRAVGKVFVQLYREGLIYKDKRLVNWDPKLLTAISDLEVVQVECKGSFKWSRADDVPFDAAALGKILEKNPNGHLYYFDYPVIDDADQPTGEVLTVATTRPETMLGDTAVAVHPDDGRYKHLVGKKVRLPLVGRLIPIVADDYSDPEKGTGAVKITPAHDFNDFEVGKRHAAEIPYPPINVLDAEGRIALQGNTDFLNSLPGPGNLDGPGRDVQSEILKLNGVDRFKVRKRIVEMMETRGLLDKIEPHVHMVPHGDRSGVVLEPRLTDQWYVNAEVLAQPALDAVREGKTKFVPENWEKTYFQWLENIQPWCISRQLWWGHQIPAWYGPEIQDDGRISLAIGSGQAISTEGKAGLFVAASETEVIEEAAKFYGKPVVIVENALAAHDRYLAKQFDSVPIWRDPDVLDTWFSSALWPFSTLGWPDETTKLKRHYPTNVLVTGFDIIFFWVARMMMMGLHFMGDVPFHDVYIHALVRDEKGAKMSKSKGNVIDPLALIDQYGADSLRFTLAAMAAQGRDIKLSTQRVEGYRNFATKLWNAARFAEMNSATQSASFDPRALSVVLNRWIIGETAKAAADVTAAIRAYRFNDAANAIYRFVWNIFCDWYLEFSKPLLMGSDEAAKAETRATTAFVLEQILKLLHPFMPFLTEELWGSGVLGAAQRDTCLALAAWPQLEGCEDAAAEAEIGFVIDVVSDVRSVRSEMNVQAGAQIPLVFVAAAPDVAARAKDWEETIKRLARLSEISFAVQSPAQSVQMVVRGTLAALPLEGIIDFAVEKVRLSKEIDKLAGEAKKIEAKLGNEDFISRAPEEVVEENRERLADAMERREKLAAALARLG